MRHYCCDIARQSAMSVRGVIGRYTYHDDMACDLGKSFTPAHRQALMVKRPPIEVVDSGGN